MTLESDEEEHSLELQLPFLAKIFRGKENFSVVPIMVGHLTESKQKYYASIIEQVLDSRTLLLISSDFCHWGDNFDYFYLESKLNTTDKTVSK